MSLWWMPVVIVGAVLLFILTIMIAVWFDSITPSTVKRNTEYRLKQTTKNWCSNYGHEPYDYYDNETHLRNLRCAICQKTASYKVGDFK